MSIEDQIEFIDEMLAHTGNPEELEALQAIRESLVGLNPSGKRRTKSKAKITLQYYQEFVGEYDQFCRKTLGAPGVIDARQGLALKETVDYLMKQEKVNGDETLALQGWRYIFANWSLLSEFVQRQTKLSDIKKNIQEILFQLRNASKEAKRRKSDKDWDQYRKLRQGE
ncbi:hypothetical protein [Roseivirga sp. UBA1976]|uniref:hypothetical protein n=1 Tax=Roseivirga sp. UBA1976 TaxID=1947386 RepID=UPI00257D0B66|nr:hypothetical protein [Roseivirga sp. UBA1976]|tara:strand:- start:3814 stop:4320 length:507 start_codon:yes stop_codon:yes gene_type:complete